MKGLFHEGESESVEKRLGVNLVATRKLDGDLKSVRLYDIGLRNFWENGVFLDSKVEVSLLIERPSGDSTEVAYAWKNDGDELLKESVHSVASKGDGHSNRHSFTEFEVGDGLAGVLNFGKLTSDEGEVVPEAREILISTRNIGADAHVEDNLFDLWDLHDVLDAELLLKLRKDFGLILLLEIGHSGSFVRGYARAFPDFFAMRIFLFPSILNPIRVGFLVEGSMTMTFDTWIARSISTI